MPKRKRDFRWIKWLIFLILIIVAVVVVVLVKQNYFDKKPENNNQASSNTGKQEDKKEEKNEGEDKENPGEEQQKAPQYDGESPNKSDNLTGLITYADVMNDKLIIRVNIDQFLSSGNCNLIMSRNGVTYYTKSVAIQESVTTSTCDGYEIPVSELSNGDFTVEIGLESEGKSGKITGRVKI